MWRWDITADEMMKQYSKFWWCIFGINIALFVGMILTTFFPLWETHADGVRFSASYIFSWLTNFLLIVVACFFLKVYPENKSLKAASILWLIVNAMHAVTSPILVAMPWEVYKQYLTLISGVQSSLQLMNMTVLLLIAYSATSPKVRKAMHLVIGVILFQVWFNMIWTPLNQHLPYGWSNFYYMHHLYVIFTVLCGTAWAYLFAMLAMEEDALRNEEVVPLPENRGLGKMILWGILTIGAYPMYIYTVISQEINRIGREDGKKTMNYLWVAWLLTWVTCLIYSFVWTHGYCNRVRDALAARGIDYRFSARDFWLWSVLGILIIVGPLVFVYKLMKASNLLATSYNSQAN